MIPDRNRGIQNLVLLCQCMLVTTAFWSWLWLCYSLPTDYQGITHYVVCNAFVLLGLLMGSKALQPDAGLHIPGFEESNRRSFRQLGLTLFYLLLYLVAVQFAKISRLFLFSFIPLLYLILFVTNRLLPRLMGRLIFRKAQKQQVLLLGPKTKALSIKHWLDENKHLGLEVLGLLTDDADVEIHDGARIAGNRTTNGESENSEPGRWPLATGCSGAQTLTAVASATVPSIKSTPSSKWGMEQGQEAPSFAGNPFSDSLVVPAAGNGSASSARQARRAPGDPLPILGRPEDLEKVLAAPGIMKVIMVEFPRGNGTVRHYTNLCEARGIRLLVVADLDRIFGHSVAVFEDQGVSLISLREEPLEDPINRFIKRCLDIIVTACVLMFVLPICGLVVWCMQRLQSPGPLFYRQTRPGLHNLPFNIYKFRTLHVGNPDVNRLPGPEDPRVYPAGRFFRKFSVDEIPQFLNVLRGHMSVVGPRPHLMADNERFPQLFNKAYVRTFVKPGITGLAQARGFRGSAKTPEEVAIRIESDIEYLENWSLWLDCWLILRTALQMVVPPKTAV